MQSEVMKAVCSSDGQQEAGRVEEGIATPCVKLVFCAGFDGLGGGVLEMDDQLGGAGGFLGHKRWRREQGRGSKTVQCSQTLMSSVETTARHPHG